MKRVGVRFSVLCLLLVFSVFFGVSLATKGIDNVQGVTGQGGGPTESSGAHVDSDPSGTEQGTAPAPAQEDRPAPKAVPESKPEKPPAPSVEPVKVADSSLVNHVMNKTGEALRALARKSIHTFVSALDSVFD